MKKFFFLGVFLLYITNTFGLVIININTNWTTNQTRNDNIEIRQGAILTISAGVTVTFTGNYYLKVKNGNIIANGTSNSNITFTTNSSKWAGIIYDSPNGGSQSQFNYCIFEYAKKGTNKTCLYTSSDCGGALYINDWGDISVRNCTFSYNNATRGGAVYISSYSSNITTDPYFESNTFENNEADGGGAVACNGYNNSSVCSPTFYNNIFNDNLAYWSGGAFFIEKSGVPYINSNYFTGNNCDCSYPVSSISGGGAIAISLASDPIIENNEINANFCSCEGGAMIIWDVSEPVISTNHFGNNTADGDGGAIYVNASEPTMQYNEIHHNTTDANGGGISFTSGSNALCSTNNIYLNTAYNDGGGVYCDNSVPYIEHDSLKDNHAYNNGGGICCVDNTTLADQNIWLNYILHNIADGDGGGIYNDADLVVNIINNLIIKNHADNGNGGGIYFGNSQTDAVVNNNTIADNTGIGIYSINDIGIYANNILWGNTGNSANSVLSYPSNSYPKFQYCDIYGLSGTPNNNSGSNPLFYDASNDDYRVHYGNSPCIDAGNKYITPIPNIDIRGYDRVIQIYSMEVDMGVYEHDANFDPLIFIPGELVSYEEQINKDLDISLKCSPNPFVLNTNIEFVLNINCRARIEIINAQGKVVELLADKNFESGIKSAIWNTGNNPKGLYLCKITINNNKTMIQKLIVE